MRYDGAMRGASARFQGEQRHLLANHACTCIYVWRCDAALLT
jgi:hypothetical protein